MVGWPEPKVATFRGRLAVVTSVGSVAHIGVASPRTTAGLPKRADNQLPQHQISEAGTLGVRELHATALRRIFESRILSPQPISPHPSSQGAPVGARLLTRGSIGRGPRSTNREKADPSPSAAGRAGRLSPLSSARFRARRCFAHLTERGFSTSASAWLIQSQRMDRAIGDSNPASPANLGVASTDGERGRALIDAHRRRALSCGSHHRARRGWYALTH
jgi:hypothetical protein